MRHARSKLAQRPQFVGPRGAFALLFLFGDVVRNSQHAGDPAVHHNRRMVNQRIAEAAITGVITGLEGLQFTAQHRRETPAPHVVIAFVGLLKKVVADDFVKFKAGQVDHGLVAPLVTAFDIERVDYFARALENVLQQRLSFAGDSFDVAQFGKVARRADGAHGFPALIEHRLDCGEH